MLLSVAHAPPSVSWRPHVSATIVSSTLPFDDISCVPGRQIDVRLRADRVLRRVAVGVVVRVVEQRVDRLVALEVDDAQVLAAADLVDPRLAGRDDGVVDGGAGSSGFRRSGIAVDASQKVPLGQGEAAPVLRARRCGRRRRPRPARARAHRQRRPASARSAGFGSSGCWQVLRMTSTFISARSSTNAPGREWPGDELHVAVVVDDDLAEEVDRRGQVARGRGRTSPARSTKLVVGVLVVVVAVLLVARLAVLRVDQRGVGAAAQRIVPADRVLGDRAQDAAHVRIQHVARASGARCAAPSACRACCSARTGSPQL